MVRSPKEAPTQLPRLDLSPYRRSLAPPAPRAPRRCRERRLMPDSPPDPLTRSTITEPFCTGVRAIDGLLTCGKGQRIGIFAGSGVGKSILLGMIARNTAAEVNVIGLIGERGREVKDFLEKDL